MPRGMRRCCRKPVDWLDGREYALALVGASEQIVNAASEMVRHYEQIGRRRFSRALLPQTDGCGRHAEFCRKLFLRHSLAASLATQVTNQIAPPNRRPRTCGRIRMA